MLRPGGTLVMQCSKRDLVGTLDKAVLAPLVSLARTRRLPRVTLPEGWVNVRYSERELDALAREAGFERQDRAFNHYMVLPSFLRRRYPRRAIDLAEAARRRRALGRLLAVNYIGVYA